MQRHGFSLTELLVVMALLAIIGGFTIPKVINAQSTKSYNTSAKAAAHMVHGAFMDFQLENSLASTTVLTQMTPFMNYVSLTSAGSIDDTPTNGSLPCTSPSPCLKLGSGGTIRLSSVDFGGTANTNAVFFNFDPDGVDSGGTTGDSKSVRFYLYLQSGKMTTRGTVDTNTCNSSTCWNPNAAQDPTWFDWGT